MAAEDAMLIETLLDSKGMLRRGRICQTVAEQEFDLKVTTSGSCGAAATSVASLASAAAAAAPADRSLQAHRLQDAASIVLCF